MPLLLKALINRLVFPGQESPALTDINLTIGQGEFIVITGSVASGKSALCHCLTGAVPHFFPAHLEGEVRVDGRNLREMTLPRIAGLVGYMMQDPQNQIFSVTVGEDIAFGPGNLGLPRQEVRDRVTGALDFVGLKGFQDRAPETLSGGEAQRAVLAGVLALQPRLLVLDQPAAELDPAGRKDIYSRLGALIQTGQSSIIMVTEHPEELEQYATRYLVMDKGKIMVSAPVLPGIHHAMPPNVHHSVPSHVQQPVAPHIRQTLPRYGQGAQSGDSSRKDEAVALEKCTYIYPDGQVGCRDVSLTLCRGELVALAGLNGSGKTTVARHFNGLVRPAPGWVRVFGRDLQEWGLKAVREKVGFLFQNPDYQIFAGSVREEVEFGLKIRKLPSEEIKRRVARVLEITGLTPCVDIHPHRLSRGQRQLLALASILACEPEIIVADEPTAGLNRSMAAAIAGHLKKMADTGCAVLVVTHDLELAAGYANRVVAMHKGEIRYDLPGGEISANLAGLREIGLDFGPVLPNGRPEDYVVSNL